MTCDPIALHAKLNLAENEVQQAMRAAKKSDFAKVWTDIAEAKALLDQAKAMCHDDVPHEHPAPTPSPTPAPAPAPVPTLPGEPSGLYPATQFTEAEWTSVTRKISEAGVLPGSDAGNDTSSFRLKLRPSGILVYDDPVLYPGQPGAAHLHHGYSVVFDAFTTHETLMKGSCNLAIQGGPLYHSAIFAPAMVNVLTNEANNLHGGDLYYKAWPNGHPRLLGREMQNVPAGLMFVAKGGTFTLGQYYDEDRNINWITKAHPTLQAMIAEWDSLTGGRPIPAGYAVRMGLTAPNCWNGKDLFLPDSSHLTTMVRDPNTGQERAPDSHPIVIPTPHPLAMFKTLVEDEVRHWRLSSDPVDAAAGSSVHWDYIEAINPRVRDGMMEVFEAHRSTSGGPIGSTGRALLPAPGDGSPARIPVPPRPGHEGHPH